MERFFMFHQPTQNDNPRFGRDFGSLLQNPQHQKADEVVLVHSLGEIHVTWRFMNTTSTMKSILSAIASAKVEPSSNLMGATKKNYLETIHPSCEQVWPSFMLWSAKAANIPMLKFGLELGLSINEKVQTDGETQTPTSASFDEVLLSNDSTEKLRHITCYKVNSVNRGTLNG
jgi:hypothetical protein